MKKALRFNREDNVAVALEDLEAGDRICLNGEETELTVNQPVPCGHKIAIEKIPAGAGVRKYGQLIGTAGTTIERGDYVHVHNVLDRVTDWRSSSRDYTYDPGSVSEIAEEFTLREAPALYGYRRKDGSIGFRNYLLVVSTCVCANQPVEELKIRMRDHPEVVCITNPSGCIILPNDRAMQKNMLLGLARNPNVGAVLFAGLGCEAVCADKLCGAFGEEKPSAYFISREYDSCQAAAEALEKKALEFLEEIRREKKEEASVADIRLGLQCGASDWTTGAAANPAIGYCSDLVVKNGGISILGETCGWFGGESVLIRQSRNAEVASEVIGLMERIYDRCLSFGYRVEEANPAPGNIAGGITTLCEKALGNTLKGGTAPIEGVLAVGERPERNGFFVLDNPGLDPVSVFAQTMSSCNVIVYSTGRGSPVGTPLAPVIKLTASPSTAASFGKHMDVVLTDLVTGETSIAEGGKRIFRKLIDICNGELSIAEANGHREYAFPLMMGPM